MTEVFGSEAYLALEADRIGGEPLTLSAGPHASIGVIRQETAQGSGLLDATSVYGYPRFPRVDSPDDFRDGLSATQRAGADAGLVALYLRMQPETPIPSPLPAGIAVVPVGNVVAVDLRVPWSEILASFRSQLRYDVRKHHDLYSIERSAAKTDEFADLYTENMTRVNAADMYFFSHDYFRRLSDIDGVTFWYLRSRSGELAAAAVTVDEGDTVYYHLGASHAVHARQASMKVLLSQIIEHHADRHWDQLVLGGGVGGKDDSLLRFKRGFSSGERSVSAARIVCDMERYVELGGSPDPSAGYFPAYRAK